MIIEPCGNKKVKAKKDPLIRLVKENKHKSWYVCSHDNPDPDSMASGFAMCTLLHFLGVDSATFVYCGEISHSQNRAMLNVLQLKMSKWDDSEVQEDAMYVFVDCSYNQKNMSIKRTPDVVIDHHKISTSNKEVLFIQDDVGACSTLLFDLTVLATRESNDPEPTVEQCFNPEEDRIKELATALAIGIKTDTQDFLSENTQMDDISAFRQLAQYISDEKFNKIVQYEFPPYMLDYEQIAWSNKKVDYTPNLITGLGFVEESQSDCIAHIADRFMRVQGVQTVVVYGLVGKSIRASVRTSSAAFDCASLCDEIFGKGNSGSKHGSAGARVSFNVFDPEFMNENDKKTLWDLAKSQIESKFEKAIKR